MTCLCGDYSCPSCGRAMGTYRGPVAPDGDELYESHRQKQLDEAVAAGDFTGMAQVLTDMARDTHDPFRRDQVRKVESLLRSSPYTKFRSEV